MIESQGRKAKVANKTRNILHPTAVQAVFEVEFDLCAFAQCSKPQIPPGMPVSMSWLPDQVFTRFKRRYQWFEHDLVAQRGMDFPSWAFFIK